MPEPGITVEPVSSGERWCCARHAIPGIVRWLNRKQQAKRKRCGVLEAMMAILVLVVGLLLAVVVHEKHEEIGDQFRQRMNAVGDEALGLADQNT